MTGGAPRDRARQLALVLWAPFLAGFALVGFDEVPDQMNAVLARTGVGVSVPGTPPEAFARLLDKGPDYRAALSARRLLESRLSRDAATAVVVEKFHHWTGRTPASRMLGLAGPAVVPMLTRLLAHDEERVRQQAALALGDIGLAAASAAPELLTLARRTPPDTSSRAAWGALGDVAPGGVGGWLAKIWYETPLLPVVIIVLVPFLVGAFYPRFLKDQEPATRAAVAPPPWLAPAAGALAVPCLAFALLDLAGARFTVEADVWALAAAVFWLGVSALARWLRRRAGSR